MKRIELVILLACAALAAGACGQSTPSEPAAPAAPAEPAQSPAAAPSQPPAAPAPAAKPSDRVEDPTFELSASPAGPNAAGKLGSFAVSLKPRGVYHINQDYPMSIAVSPNASIELPKTNFSKPEAAEFGEQLARFDVPFTPKAAGSHTVEAKVKFAVCTPENCVPDERTLAVVLPVE
jgi:hypothetical protein